jgi:hypothetical protein
VEIYFYVWHWQVMNSGSMKQIIRCKIHEYTIEYYHAWTLNSNWWNMTSNSHGQHEVTGAPQSVQRRAAGWMAGVRFPAGVRHFSLLHGVQTSSGAGQVSYPMGTGGSFHGGKAAGAWSCASKKGCFANDDNDLEEVLKGMMKIRCQGIVVHLYESECIYLKK